MKYNRETHHRRSIRLPGYDYAQPGAYYVTICTHGRQCILDDDHLRGIVERAWGAIVNPSASVEDGDFVVMPNHVHGIVWILEGTPVGARHHDDGAESNEIRIRRGGFVGDVSSGASPLRPFRAPASAPLATIVGSFKSNAARRINNIRRTPGAPVWQGNYYEHIVRNEADLRRVREYIRDNPRRWVEDPDNPANFNGGPP